MREITLSQAVNEALAEEMRRDETVFIIGEDVAEAGTPFKVLSGLVEEFGTARVVDTPIAEPGFMGIAVGAAMTGTRPVVDLMFGDFMMTGLSFERRFSLRRVKWVLAPHSSRRTIIVRSFVAPLRRSRGGADPQKTGDS